MRRSAPVAIAVLLSAWAAKTQAQTQALPPFGNARLQARVATPAGHLSSIVVQDGASHASLALGEPFRLLLHDGQEVSASNLRLLGPPRISPIAADPHASRAAAQQPGQQLCADLQQAANAFTVHWCLISRKDQPYLRQEITVRAGQQPLPLTEVQGFHFNDPAAHVVGSVAGSPIVRGDFYLGLEHPLSYSTVDHGTVTAGIKRMLPLAAGQSITYSSVVGVVRPGQLRRDFLSYVEQERAHPYRTFLHYNTWYDLGAGNRFDEAGVLNRMHAFGTELVQKRSVTMDSFLMDDGWDKTASLWQFDSGFPHGFAPLRTVAKQYGFGIGVWLSPWGGYDEEKKQRIAYGSANGYEIVDGGYALSGPRYYAQFERACLDFIKRDGVNQFKLDGTGNANRVFPGSIFDSDFAAAIHLIDRMRQQSNQLFVNLTTGTWPSPFWLRFADSTFRLGEDHAFAGEGSWRQRWITYRDAQTYANIVRRGPLFPLNSLMLHGIIFAQHAEHLADDPGHDFAAEVHSYFGTGTQLQEMYITPSLLSSADWDVLAESARWSRRNAATLKDTHWVGGDPAKGEVYGWASWNEDAGVQAGGHVSSAPGTAPGIAAGILVLRNPTPRPQQIVIDVRQAFELPRGAAQHYKAHSPWAADRAQSALDLRAGTPHTFALAPFQVLTLEAQPAS